MLYESADGLVKIDSDFLRVGAKSYAISKINSVEVRKAAPAGCGCAMIFGIVAGLALAIGLFALGKPGSGLFFIVALLTGGIGIAFGAKAVGTGYHLYVVTSSGSVQAYQSATPDVLVEIKAAIEETMVGR